MLAIDVASVLINISFYAVTSSCQFVAICLFLRLYSINLLWWLKHLHLSFYSNESEPKQTL